jgi:hypothetical protein
MASHSKSKLIFSLIVASLAMICLSGPGTASVLAVKMLLNEGNKAHMFLHNQIRVNTVAKVNGGLVQKQ